MIQFDAPHMNDRAPQIHEATYPCASEVFFRSYGAHQSASLFCALLCICGGPCRYRLLKNFTLVGVTETIQTSTYSTKS